MNPITVTIILIVLLLGVIGTGAYFILGKEKTNVDDVEEIESTENNIVNQPSSNVVSNPVNTQTTANTQTSSSRWAAVFGSGSRRGGSSSSSSSSSSNSQQQNQISSPPPLPESELNNFVPPALPQ